MYYLGQARLIGCMCDSRLPLGITKYRYYIAFYSLGIRYFNYLINSSDTYISDDTFFVDIAETAKVY
jgi:hypothetical protein